MKWVVSVIVVLALALAAYLGIRGGASSDLDGAYPDPVVSIEVEDLSGDGPSPGGGAGAGDGGDRRIQADGEFEVVGGELVGTVTILDGGGPAAGASLSIFLPGSSSEGRVETVCESDGSFGVELERSGRYEVVAEHPRGARTVLEGVRVEHGRRTRVTVALEPACSALVKVVEAGSGIPVAGVDVEVFTRPPAEIVTLSDLAREARTSGGRTDDSGWVRIDHLPSGRLGYRVSGGGVGAVEGEFRLEPPRSEIEIEVGRAGRVEGVVVDFDGFGVPGALVALAPLPAAEAPTVEVYANRSTDTDGNGWFALEGVPAGEHRLAAMTRDGLLAFVADGGRTVSVEAGATAEVTLAVLEPIDLAGRVVDDAGEAVASAHLWLSTSDLWLGGKLGLGLPSIDVNTPLGQALAPEVMSQSDGSFRFGPVRGGSPHLTIRVECPGYDDGRFKLSEQELRSGPVELTLTRLAGSISGTIRGPDGAGVANVAVFADQAFPSGPRDRAMAITDGAGRYAVPLFAAVVEVEVRPELTSAQARRWRVEPPTRSAPGQGAADVDFRLVPSSTVEGRVTGPLGGPLRDFELFLVTGAEVGLGMPVRNDQGRFELPVDPSLHEALIVAAEGLVPARVGAAELFAGEPLTIRLDGGTILAGRVEDAAGDPVGGARLVVVETEDGGAAPPSSSVLARAVTDAQGHFELAGLSPGYGGRLSVFTQDPDLPSVSSHAYAPADLVEAGLVIRLGAPIEVAIEFETPDRSPPVGRLVLHRADGGFVTLPDNGRRDGGGTTIAPVGSRLELRLPAGAYELNYFYPDRRGDPRRIAIELAVDPDGERERTVFVPR